MSTNTKVTVSASIEAPVQKVWDAWNNPEDIKQWNTADPSWHCPASENDLREGGSFKHRMEARDGSFGFDFGGVYDKVVLHKEITYTMSDGRMVTTLFEEAGNTVTITSTFDAETENPVELQQQGWQAILNNFVQYVTNK
ncbi:SRPBCC family protein [Sediminibacterium sp.]|uniref:SRPBCC family protein n=1 Tax=Sediminibacterium sp. TaxID=1917865 RepID=UPI0025F1C649|nr:SRPBCC family protein [Sediminibacterium sp.]MBW0179320.1 SRPBCC family protein [Sediminibacterium sp.]